ncbi:MAG: MBL fold metallo-hydrolase, partial [Halobacteria archaeon]|nr:MBL fold metallo-hydrolase [Halobacteria archaeon]
GGMFTADEAGMYLHGNLHPTTPPPNFDLERNLESLDQLAEYDPEFLLYTHYGRRDDAVEALRGYDRLLRAWVDEVERVRRREENDEDVVKEFVGRDHVYYDIWDETSARETIRMDVEGVLLYLDG